MKRADPWAHGYGIRREPEKFRTFSTWYKMLRRCTDKKDKDYRHYGGVKRIRGGAYPTDWYAKVVMSGLAGKVQASWK